ncbi:MAG: molybdopterin molybdenumtransferase MoeA, partial [Elusimicrobia bacterium]|nr:molybdopterin molybdenumtransferase MoeA [Elusimicrobiota bacterium]
PRRPACLGKIHDSNGPALAAALAQAGIRGLNGGIFPDDPAILAKAFKKFLERSDLMLITGGVSVGDYDYTRRLLEKIGIKVVFWKVAIKPGKPLLFGRRGRKLVFGLPGNPLSALVCFDEFVRPALEKMQGLRPETFRYLHQGRLLHTYIKERGRAQCLFARAAGRPDRFKVRILSPQGSALVARAARANAMAWGPLGVRRLKKGDKIYFRWLK